MKITAWKALLIIMISFGCGGCSVSEVPVFLGIIEPSRTHYVGEISTMPFVARAVFQWNGNKWSAFPCTPQTSDDLKKCIAKFPKHVSWTMAFNGENRGQFNTTRPPKWESYSDVGLLWPDSSVHVRLIQKGANEFVYWWEEQPFRPMVLVSKPNVSDPDRWIKTNVSLDVVRHLIPIFHKVVKSAHLSCTNKITRNYSDKLIQVRKSYKSASRALLVQLALNDSSVRNCDGPRDEEFDSRWFYVNGDTVRFVGQSLELIDAGDYDNDGHSEVVFHKPGYNYDGYLLLYNQLQEIAEFGWNYQ